MPSGAFWTASRARPHMSSSPGPREERTEREDVAALVPFFGVVLLLPPFLNLFAGMIGPFGVPVEVLYLFGVWFLVIAGAVLLSRGRQFRETPAKSLPETGPAAPPEPPGHA